MDSVINSVAEERYQSDMENSHKILSEYFEKQPDSFSDKKNKEIWWDYYWIIGRLQILNSNFSTQFQH